jgi:hypothetical protein
MAIAATATRQEKEKWLTRPIDWAWNSSFFGGCMGLLMWLNGVETGYVLTIAIGSNICAAVLLGWAVKRITNAARGRC